MTGEFLGLPRRNSNSFVTILVLLLIAGIAFGINLYLRPEFWESYVRFAEDPPTSLAEARFAYEAASDSRVIRKNDKRFLYGGEKESDHFDITEFRLNPLQLNYGIGREAFPALIKPEFQSAEDANKWLNEEAPVLAVKIGDEVKVYPVDLLTRHEVVNDVVGGRPIFAAYCILADLGAVYDRLIDDHTHTFALSGYTYRDPEVWYGRNAFVMWDRETESLWWPPIGRAVSGPMIDTPMKVLDEDLWAQTTWGEVRGQYPNAMVLAPGQDFERPTEWERVEVVSGGERVDAPSSEVAIAPHWGENATIEAHPLLHDGE